MTIRVRHLYRWAGDHLAFRDASEHVPDVRDLPDVRMRLHNLELKHFQIIDQISADLAAKMQTKSATTADFEAASAAKASAEADRMAEHARIVAEASASRDAEIKVDLIAMESDEVQFDHPPSEAELDAAFPQRGK